ncbi:MULTISPECIES: DUF3100 domain-containing protein [unclassified Haladaptatus]|uniref:DUF3100 domain-containing protein n=1 Tax=unclassified Haladaptatus TaxID=2622732 RepID=UPI002FCDEE82
MTSDSSRWEPIRTAGRWSAHLRTHGTVFAIVVVAELIGTQVFPLGPGQVVLLPMLFAVIFGILLSYSVLGKVVEPLRNVVSKDVSKIASPLLIIALMPLGVKYGSLVAPAFYSLVEAGPAFVLQEFGNLATILFALPLALALGLKREAIGGAVSIAREPTLGVITDKYGIDSAEGRGVLGTYMTGTVLGTVFFGILGGFAPATGLHPLSLSMACGMGSASMMTACSSSLANVVTTVPKEDILAFASTSNLLTGITGLYMVLFIGLPVINRLYAKLAPLFGGDD